MAARKEALSALDSAIKKYDTPTHKRNNELLVGEIQTCKGVESLLRALLAFDEYMYDPKAHASEIDQLNVGMDIVHKFLSAHTAEEVEAREAEKKEVEKKAKMRQKMSPDEILLQHMMMLEESLKLMEPTANFSHVNFREFTS